MSASIVNEFAAVGTRLNEMNSVEAAAGNISAFAWDLDVGGLFDSQRDITLPVAAPALAGGTAVITGGGCRLRDLAHDLAGNIGAVRIHPDGRTGTMHFKGNSGFNRPTAEFNSHLAILEQQVLAGAQQVAVVHAQPPNIVMLTQIPEYRSARAMTRAVLRWEAETIVFLPEGLGYVPFELTGSEELMRGTLAGLVGRRLVVWEKHGVISRGDSPLHACDLIDYAETGAAYEVTNLRCGERGTGLTDAELARVVQGFGLDAKAFDL